MEQSSSLRINDLPDPDSIRLFVSHIPPCWNEDEIRYCFEAFFGRIYLVDVLAEDANSNPGQTSTGSSCFIIYHTRKSSMDAQIAWNNSKKLNGMKQPLQMQIAEKEPVLDRKVFLEMLSKKMETMDLCMLLKAFGPIEECGIFRDSKGLSKGSGYAIFAAKAHLMKAKISLHGKVILEERKSPIIMTLAASNDDVLGGDETDNEDSNSRDPERITPSVPPGFDPIPPNVTKRLSYVAEKLQNFEEPGEDADEIIRKTSDVLEGHVLNADAAKIGITVTSIRLKPSAKAGCKSYNPVMASILPETSQKIPPQPKVPPLTLKPHVPKYSDVVKEDRSYMKFITTKEIVAPQPDAEAIQESNAEISEILAMDFQDGSFKYGAAEGWSIPSDLADSGGGGDTCLVHSPNFNCGSNYQEKEICLKSEAKETVSVEQTLPARTNAPKAKILQKASCSKGIQNSMNTTAKNTINVGVGTTKRSKGVQSGGAGSTKDFVVQITDTALTANYGGGATKVYNSYHPSAQTVSQSSIQDTNGATLLSHPSISPAHTHTAKASTMSAIVQNSETCQKYTQFPPTNTFQAGYPWPPLNHCSSEFPSATVLTHHHHTSMNSIRTTISGTAGYSHSTLGHNFNFQAPNQQHQRPNQNPHHGTGHYLTMSSNNSGGGAHGRHPAGNYRTNPRSYSQAHLGPSMQAQMGGGHPYAGALVHQSGNGMMGHAGNHPYSHPNSMQFLAPPNGSMPCSYTNLVQNLCPPNAGFVYTTYTNQDNSGVIPSYAYGSNVGAGCAPSGARINLQHGTCSYAQNPHTMQNYSHNGMMMPALPFAEFENSNNGYSNGMHPSGFERMRSWSTSVDFKTLEEKKSHKRKSMEEMMASKKSKAVAAAGAGAISVGAYAGGWWLVVPAWLSGLWGIFLIIMIAIIRLT